jgi:hypothetical protein
MKPFKHLAAATSVGLLAIAAPFTVFAHPGHGEGMTHDLSHAASYVVAALALTYWSARAYRAHAKQKPTKAVPHCGEQIAA